MHVTQRRSIGLTPKSWTVVYSKVTQQFLQTDRFSQIRSHMFQIARILQYIVRILQYIVRTVYSAYITVYSAYIIVYFTPELL